MFAVVEPGDEVIIVDPAWPHYDGHVRLAGGVPVHVQCEATEAFRLDPDRVEAAITGHTRALVISSPCNPTGAVIDGERIAALARLCIRHDLIALSDEIYSDFVYDEAAYCSIADEPGMAQRTVVVDSCSKSWSMTGWRVGWAIAPSAIGERLNAVHQHLGVCAPAFAQAGARAAVLQGGPHTVAMIEEYGERRRALVAALADLPAVSLDMPLGAFYAFPAVKGREPARRLLEEAGVAVVPGETFGEAWTSHIRISYAVSEDTLAEGIARLQAFLSA
jgi:aminotransferase